MTGCIYSFTCLRSYMGDSPMMTLIANATSPFHPFPFLPTSTLTPTHLSDH